MRKRRNESVKHENNSNDLTHNLTRQDVNSICRYWVESRMSQLLNNDALLTRSGLSIEVKQNQSTGLMSWFFKVNDRNVASVDSNGFIWCSNLVVNGIDFVRMVKNIITTNKEIDNLGTIYVKHEDLHDGNYSLDVRDVKTKHLIVQNDGERYDTIELKAAEDSGFITFDSFYPWLELGLNTHKNMLQLSDLMNTTEMRINCVKAGQYSDDAVFVFGKDDTRGNAFQLRYFHLADDSENNHLELSAYDYANHFLEIHRNLIETCLPNVNLFSENDDMTVKIGARDARGRNLMIYYDNMSNTSDCHAVVGLQGWPALTFHTDELEILMNLLVSTITGTGNWNTTGTMSADVYYGNTSNVSTINCSSLNVNGNLINQLLSTLAAGEEVGFMFGKANNIYLSGVLSYHLDSTVANSYLDLKVNGTSGLRVYSDKVESITPFTCPSLTVGGSNVDAANIAYKNQPNTFTQTQTIDVATDNTNAYVAKFLNSHMYSNNYTAIVLGRNQTTGDCCSIRYYWSGSSSNNNKIVFNHYGISEPLEIYSANISVKVPTTITTSTDATWNYILSMVNPNLTEGHHTAFGFGKSISGSTSGEIAYEYSDTEANRRIKIGFYSTNINSTWIYPSRTEFNRPITIWANNNVDSLQVYNNNGNNANAYIWVGNVADNAYRGTFGWVGNATAANRHMAVWCRGVEIQDWYNDKTYILKPLTITGNTSITGNLTITSTTNSNSQLIYAENTANTASIDLMKLYSSNIGDGNYISSYFGKNGSYGIAFSYRYSTTAPYCSMILRDGGSNVNSISIDKTTTTINGYKLTNTGLFQSDNSKYIATVLSDGVMEIGRYIDFHLASSTADYDARLQYNGTTLETNKGLKINGKLDNVQTTPANAFGDNMKLALLQLMYPVGSVYQNATDSRNPNEILGATIGEWVQIQNYYLYANPQGSTTGPNGGSGGDINHTHTYGARWVGWNHCMCGLNGDYNFQLNNNGSWANGSNGGSSTARHPDGWSSSGGNAIGYANVQTGSSGSYPPYYRVWTWYRSK